MLRIPLLSATAAVVLAASSLLSARQTPAPAAATPAARANARIRMLWIACGTGDNLIGANRQFKDWLRSKGVQFTELEVPDAGHVWPLWRQNVADMVPKLFKRASGD